jgi:hypothetical protein
MGCNDFSCPIYHVIPATVLYSDFTQKTCSCCLEESDDGCLKWGSCDCSFFNTGFMHEIGTCGLQTHQKYEVGETTQILVQRYSHDCKLETNLDSNIVWVGIVFCCIASIVLVIWCICGIVMIFKSIK